MVSALTRPAARKLINDAADATQFAFAPYSQLLVGAAVLCSDGTVFRGVNVENSSFGLTICAERAALFAAIAAGKRSFKAVAVSCLPRRTCAPCGACRQVIFELAPDCAVVWQLEDDTVMIKAISKMLPDAFSMSEPR